jgi:hypothetical protein
MVLLGRIELPTSSLPMTRSTTELQQPTGAAGLCEQMPAMSSHLRHCTRFAKETKMKKPKPKTKEERLSEALRANLRRRKLGSSPSAEREATNSQKPAD